MILSDGEILKAIRRGEIIIDPEPVIEQYAPSSLDLHIGDEVYRWDPNLNTKGMKVNLVPSEWDILSLLSKFLQPLPKESDGSIILHPKEFVLSMTKEYIMLPLKSKIAARVEGRSSLARAGISIHFTAPTIHCSFSGKIVLEMYNHGPFDISLRLGETKICQLIFERLGKRPLCALKSVFQKQKLLR